MFSPQKWQKNEKWSAAAYFKSNVLPLVLFSVVYSNSSKGGALDFKIQQRERARDRWWGGGGGFLQQKRNTLRVH